MLALLTLALAVSVAPQDPVDPEQTPAGRKVYLGREVARTMHWTGAAWLMRQTREKEENGVLLRKWLAVQPGSSVCDFGCGNGYHTLPMAEAVGKGGTVYAVDLQSQMLTLLKKRCEERQLDNVKYVQATIDDPKLPPASCDQVLLVDVYHELSHPVRVMAHLRRALKPTGRVVLVEFRAEDPDVPIKPEHMMAKAQVVREMASHGFALVEEFDELPWQHAMAFSPAKVAGPRFAAMEVARSFLRAAAGKDARIVAPFLDTKMFLEDVPKLPAKARIELRAGTQGTLIAELQSMHGQYEVVMRRDTQGRWTVQAVHDAKPRRGGARPFVAMHTALGRGSVAERVALATNQGFDGVAWDLNQLDEVQTACHRMDGDLWSAYIVLDVHKADDKRLATIRSAMRTMAGGPGMLWLGLRNSKQKPRNGAGDDKAVAVLTTLLHEADVTGIEIALYPHNGFWLETCDDALRLCKRLQHQRLGMCFNLCHFLRTNEQHGASDLLKRCGKQLFAVTINGADNDGKDWSTLIQPLGQGSWDLRKFLSVLDDVPFDGPIGLQGYGIRQSPNEHLPASMAAWRAAQKGW